MAFTPQRLREALAGSLGAAGAVPTGYCIALSGGLDSTVLLAALASSPALGPLRAIHVDHGLQPDAASWSRHGAKLAARFGIEYETVRVDARAGAGESPEAVARAARYAALAPRLRRGEVLLTAHHGDDQLETVLLQWLRGGGLRALAGMPPVAAFASGWLARPLLGFTRSELSEWAGSQDLDWLEDPSNRDLRFDRNYLRLEVLPSLRRRWPAVSRTVGRVASQAAEALALDDLGAVVDLASVAEGRTVSLARLAVLDHARQRRVLRAWLRALGLPMPAAATLEALRRDMREAADDRVPETRWPGCVVRRYRSRLYADALPDPTPRVGALDGATWRPGETLDLGALGTLVLRPTQGIGLSRTRLVEALVVTTRPAGAMFRPAGSTHRRPLRKWLQERGVLPWRRASLPVVLAAGEIAAVGDLGYSGPLAAVADEQAWAIAWQGRPVLTEDEAIAARLPVAGEWPFR